MTSGTAIFTHVQRQPHDEVALEGEHDQNGEEQGEERERADAGDEASAIPLIPFEADESEAGEEPSHKRNAQVEAHALRDLADSDLDNAAFQAEPLRQHRQECPGIKTVEEHLKDAVDGHESGHIVRVAFRQLVPDQHHRNAASDADQDQATHISRFAAQEDDGQEKHQHRADDPVLHLRQAENALVAEDLSKLFVADLRQRRKHHDDEADGDGDIRCAALKAVDEGCRGRNEVADRNADSHREEDPKRQEPVEE